MPQSRYITKPLVGPPHARHRRLLSCYGLVIAVAILGLTVTLARRVVHASSPDKVSVQSYSHAKIQHLDTDASEWVAPDSTFLALWTAETLVVPEPSTTVAVRLHFESLYNRPPPAC